MASHKFGFRILIGGLLILVGFLCGVIGGTLAALKGLRLLDLAPWNFSLGLIGAMGVLFLVGKLVAGNHARKEK